ncbi:hypothetical protein [uncultured Phocaeicola sp.]|jgi:hypothetical protein|uniref:hypothetical protein n=1 Tax=uncultured Phocaeicola sp. TaxID=990718 RepID=UPI00256F1C19|nr:hypothetical protein [Bacteroides intestinalis]
MELPIRYLNEKGQLDDGETSQMRYVYDIMYGEGEPYHNADWSVVIYPSEVKLVDIPYAAEIFAERYNTGQIICPYKYEDYIRNGELQDTINGLGLDANAFWLLVMFSFDYACSMCFDSSIIAPTRGENIESLINLLPDDKDSKAKLTLKTSKGKYEIISHKTISLILEWIKRGYEQDKDSIGINTIDINNTSELFQSKEESDSVLIWYFAHLLKYFFDLKPQFKGKRKKGETVSLNKNLLISKLVYYTQLSKNTNFLDDTDTLKSFFKQYKDKDIKGFSNIYPTP